MVAEVAGLWGRGLVMVPPADVVLRLTWENCTFLIKPTLLFQKLAEQFTIQTIINIKKKKLTVVVAWDMLLLGVLD